MHEGSCRAGDNAAAVASPPTYRVPPASLGELRRILEGYGYAFEARPHQAFLARAPGSVVNAYLSGSVVLGGAKPLPKEAILWLDAHAAAPAAAAREKHPMPSLPAIRAGVDEAGKGDYFGPLVIAGVVVDPATETKLRVLGVRDSKTIGDEDVIALAARIEEVVPASAREVIAISPARYNALHLKLRNVNRILGWAHARVIESLLARDPRCQAAISDQFGDERYIVSQLQERGKAIRLVQVPRAERELAVAAASILARAEFLVGIRTLSARHDVRFPLGATHVKDAARRFVAARGPAALASVAKVHFRTTGQVVDDVAAVMAGIDPAGRE